MTKKNLKLIMELIFIFIIPLVILCINCNYQNTIEYDNNGNYQATEKHIEFNAPFNYTNGYKNIIENFNLWNEETESGYWGTETGEKEDGSNWIRCTNPINVLPNTTYYGYWENEPTSSNLIFRDANGNAINYINKTNWVNKTFTTPQNCYDIVFYFNASWIGGNICINISEQWANGNYVPYGEPLILYTNTDVSGQNNINITIWGNLKNLIVDNLQIQENQIVDIIITYTILWFIMFVIWHFFYLFFDGLIHIFIDWGHKEREKVK